VLAGYTDEAGRRPLATLARTLGGDAFPGGSDGVSYAAVYAALKGSAAPDDALAEALLAEAADA